MTQRSNANSLRPLQQKALARRPSAEFKRKTLGFIIGLDGFQTSAQVGRYQAAIRCGVVANHIRRLG
jgi:hypothetical protein